MKDTEDGKAILATTVIPEEMENLLVRQGLITRLSYNRVLYPDKVKAAGFTIKLMGEMRPWVYRYADIKYAMPASR